MKKITHLLIDSVLAIPHLELDLQAPINVFVGPNEAGKSSIRDALEWGLTGQARGLKTHQDQALLIHEGGKAAEVVITYDDGSKITRRKTAKSPPTVSGDVPEDQNLSLALCDSHHFLSLPEAQRRAELFRLIPGMRPMVNDVYGRLVQAIGREPGGAGPFLEFSAPKELSEIATSQSFKAAEDQAIAGRQEAKRALKELQAQAPEPAQKVTIRGTEYTLPDIQAQKIDEGLAKLYGERDKLLKKQGKAEGELDKLPELEAELAALVISDAPKNDAVEKCQKDFDEAVKIHQKAVEERDTLEQGSPAKLFPDMCPAHNIPCPSKGKEAVKAIPADDIKKIGKSNAEVTEWTAHKSRMEEALKEAQNAKNAYDEAVKTKTELETKITALKDQQARAAETAKLQHEIDAISGRIALGEDLKDRVREFWRKKNEADQAKDRLAQVEKEITLYDTLAKALAPNGIPSQLIAEALGPVNKLLAYASGFLFPGRTLTLTDGLEIVLSGTPLPLLSRSARFRVGIAFQYVLSRLAGARLLLIDEVDLLDPQNRANLIDFLLSIRQDFDNILVFATTDHASASPIPEMRIWVMLAGKVYPLTPGLEYRDGVIVKEREAA